MGLFSRLLSVVKMKVSSALDRAEDPREALDYAYEQQKELLRRTKQGLVEVATSKVRLEAQARRLRSKVPQIETQAARALTAGREDLARISLERKQTVLAELEGLDAQVVEVAEEESRLTQAEQQLAGHVEQFRTRREAISARYTAARAQVRVAESLTGVSEEFAELTMAVGRAGEKTDRMQARASALGTLIDAGALPVPGRVTDPVERELAALDAGEVVERELAEIRARLGPGPPAGTLAGGDNQKVPSGVAPNGGK